MSFLGRDVRNENIRHHSRTCPVQMSLLDTDGCGKSIRHHSRTYPVQTSLEDTYACGKGVRHDSIARPTQTAPQDTEGYCETLGITLEPNKIRIGDLQGAILSGATPVAVLMMRLPH